MKVLLVNSSPHEKGCVFTALDHLAERLNTHGIEAEIFSFGHTPVSGCIACGACRKSGKCFKNDLVNEFAAKCETADGFVFGTPVYYAGPSGQLISFMDRLFYSAGNAYLAETCRTYQLKEAKTGLSVCGAFKILIRFRQNFMSGVFYGMVSLDIGVNQPVQVGVVLFDLLQVAVGFIAGKRRRKYKRGMA